MRKPLKIIKHKHIQDKAEEEILRLMPEYIQVNLVKAINKYF
ncbi:hypothetical protein [Cytobacillus kochii]|nr:hypothetical protein [Cytobacillus kochii]